MPVMRLLLFQTSLLMSDLAQVWKGAAPCGPAQKKPAPATKEAAADGINSRKRAASTVQQAVHSKIPKTSKQAESHQTFVDDPEPEEQPHRPRLQRKNKQVPGSDSDYEAAPVSSSRIPRPRAPSQAQDPDDAFAEDESDGGDAEPEADDGQEDVEMEDDDDLEGLHENAVAEKLAEAIPRWTKSNDIDNEEEAEYSLPTRSSSRASNSSGHLSVPASEPISISDHSDSDREDDDPFIRAGLSGLKAAQKRATTAHVPMVNTSSKNSTGRQKTEIKQEYPRLDLSKAPPAPQKSRVNNRTAKRNAVEVPLWSDTRSSSVSRGASVHPLVKKEVRDVALPLDDTGDIAVRWSPAGTINLKEQHSDVQKMLRLGIDYYLGTHMIENFYPDVSQRANFTLDSFVNAAEDLHLPEIASAVVVEVKGGRVLSAYGEALGAVPHGRISAFRSTAKSTSKAGIYGHYKVQNDCVARVEHLMKGEAFIYKQKPDTIDPRSQMPVFGRPDTDTPYLHAAIADGVRGFLKTKTAERCTDMFPRNEQGNIEATIPLVALTCAAIYSTLDDWTTGEYKATDFEGKRVQEVYEIHTSMLQRLKESKPEQYHTTMETIFVMAASGTLFSKQSKSKKLSILEQEAMNLFTQSL
ncbi:hypothetical protein C8R45DRAFT_1082000 [Mycena sanguinolenta]|nr:hypothetical protein C8R45DRAFT_1082000 [Mycena sanguinolenta]